MIHEHLEGNSVLLGWITEIGASLASKTEATQDKEVIRTRKQIEQTNFILILIRKKQELILAGVQDVSTVQVLNLCV